MKNTIFAFLLVVSIFITSCSIKPAIEQQINSNLLVKVAVAEVLYRNPAWKSEANKICLFVLNSNDSTTIGELEEKARLKIENLDASPATKVLAQELLIGISTGIKADLQRQGIDDPKAQFAQTIEFVRWLETATR